MAFAHRPELEFLCTKGWHRALAALFDITCVNLAWQTTVALRTTLNPVMMHHISRTQLLTHVPPVSALILVWAVVAISLRLYRAERHPNAGGRLRRVLNATALLSTLLIAYGFFARQVGTNDVSRSFVLMFAPVSLLLLLASNYAVLIASVAIGRRFRFEERVAVAGVGPHAERLALTVNGGVTRVVGFILPKAAGAESLSYGAPILGTTATVAEVINRAKLDRIFVANGSLSQEELKACTRTARRMGVVTAHALAGLMDEEFEEASLHVKNGVAIVELYPRTFLARQHVIKRGLDILLSGTVLIFLLPVFAALALLVKLSSKGPVFYVSDRVGRGGRHFRFYKFRTMYTGADALREMSGVNESDGHLFKIRHDPRITPIGRFMRRFSMDELPQLFNVFLGSMSLVGPRPLPARDLDMDGASREFGGWARERTEALPGITCLWQIRGRSDLPFSKMVELDLEYVRNWSLGMDLEILLETPLAVLSGRGAY